MWLKSFLSSEFELPSLLLFTVFFNTYFHDVRSSLLMSVVHTMAIPKKRPFTSHAFPCKHENGRMLCYAPCHTGQSKRKKVGIIFERPIGKVLQILVNTANTYVQLLTYFI